MTLLGYPILKASQPGSQSWLALEFEEITKEIRGRFLAFVALEGDEKPHFKLSTDHDTFVSQERLIFVGKEKGNDEGIYIHGWDGAREHRLYSKPTNYSRDRYRAVSFDQNILTVLSK
jgi:hypothetical protein